MELRGVVSRRAEGSGKGMTMRRRCEYDEALGQWLISVRKIPRLDAGTEVELATRWRQRGDVRARDALVRANLKFVAQIALSYWRYGMPPADLVAEGNLGLLRAANKFEPSRGWRFVTYAAYWIRAYVFRYVIENWSIVHGGLCSREFFKYRKLWSTLSAQYPTDEAIDAFAEAIGQDRRKAERSLSRLYRSDVSIDATYGDDARESIVDGIRYDGEDPEQAAMRYEIEVRQKVAVRQALGVLDSRERRIVEQRMMDRPDGLSLDELGVSFGVCRGRVRQLEKRAHRKLRGRLREFAPDRSST